MLTPQEIHFRGDRGLRRWGLQERRTQKGNAGVITVERALLENTGF